MSLAEEVGGIVHMRRRDDERRMMNVMSTTEEWKHGTSMDGLGFTVQVSNARSVEWRCGVDD